MGVAAARRAVGPHGSSSISAGAEELLRKAMVARSAAARARWARQGLATRAPLDKTTQAMLLRQLYLSHFELRRFQPAHEIARQALELSLIHI